MEPTSYTSHLVPTKTCTCFPNPPPHVGRGPSWWGIQSTLLHSFPTCSPHGREKDGRPPSMRTVPPPGCPWLGNGWCEKGGGRERTEGRSGWSHQPPPTFLPFTFNLEGLSGATVRKVGFILIRHRPPILYKGRGEWEGPITSVPFEPVVDRIGNRGEGKRKKPPVSQHRHQGEKDGGDAQQRHQKANVWYVRHRTTEKGNWERKEKEHEETGWKTTRRTRCQTCCAASVESPYNLTHPTCVSIASGRK